MVKKLITLNYSLLRFVTFTLALILTGSGLYAQKGVTAFGVQFKPILPLGLINTNGLEVTDVEKGTTLSIDEKGGYAFGGVIRIGLTKRLSIETGINYAVRNYGFELAFNSKDTSRSTLRFTSYEIPLTGMVYVQLGEQFFMNASAGFSFDLFPTGGVVEYDRDTIEYGMVETSWLQYGLTANLGFEYRTEKMGYFYIGSSFHQPLSDMAIVYISSQIPNTNAYRRLISPEPTVLGTYLTLDIRYFFNPGKKADKR